MTEALIVVSSVSVILFLQAYIDDPASSLCVTVGADSTQSGIKQNRGSSVGAYRNISPYQKPSKIIKALKRF